MHRVLITHITIFTHARCQIDNTITGSFYNSESNISLYLKEYFRFVVNLEIGLTTGYSGGDIVFMRYTDRGWFVSTLSNMTKTISA